MSINTQGGRSVVVTGASSGIGKACALHLEGLGFNVFAGVRKEADGERLRTESAGKVTPVSIDVTDRESISAAASQVEETVGERGLAGLVNNAGVAISGPLEFIPIEELRRQLEVNLVGQVAVTQAFLRCCARDADESSTSARSGAASRCRSSVHTRRPSSGSRRSATRCGESFVPGASRFP